MLNKIPVNEFKQNSIKMVDSKLIKSASTDEQMEEQKVGKDEMQIEKIDKDAVRLPNITQIDIQGENMFYDPNEFQHKLSGFHSPTNYLVSND